MPKTPDYFVGKTIIITGAASGIGRAAARSLRARAQTSCARTSTATGHIRPPGRSSLMAAKRSRWRPTSHRAGSQRHGASRDRIFRPVQFQFNSAGAALRRSKFLDIDDALFENTFALNVKGTLYCMQAVLPHMLETGTASSSTWRAWRTGAAARARRCITRRRRARWYR